MFREMRRKAQALSEKECDDILQRGTSGVLALLGDEQYPYAVPLSYVYDGAKIYFHSAKTGHKIDAVKRCDKASFCVIDKDDVQPERYTTYFKSVIVFGKIHILDEKEALSAIEKLGEKYYPDDSKERRRAEIDKAGNAFYMMELSVLRKTGKQAIETVKK